MSPRLAYVFPGQGAQAVGMGKDLYEAFASARTVFEQANAELGFSISRLCFEGPDDSLKETAVAQPAVVTVSLACLAAYEESHPGGTKPLFVAGHSLGEYTALAAAGFLDFGSAIRLARERGQLMAQASRQSPGGMAAVMGLAEDVLAQVCAEAGCQIANYNSPGQLVISGTLESLSKATKLTQERGAAKVMPLAVSGAFHTLLMQPAAEGLRIVIDGLKWRPAGVPLVANTTAAPVTETCDMKAELLAQLTSSVQWQRSVEYMIGQGVDTFIEIGPGKVLAGLIKRINRDVRTINISDAQGISTITI